MDGVMSDGYYGSDSEETIFRNWITGKSYPLALKRFSRNFSVVGNQIGTDGLHTGSYSFGQPNIGNGSSEGFAVQSSGTYWLDWSPLTGPKITGSITTRASDSDCTITLTNGNSRLRDYAYRVSSSGSLFAIGVDWGTGARLAMSGGAWTGDVVHLSGGYPDALPPVGTAVGLWPRAEGFQERDLDVGTTTILKANRYSGANGYFLGVNENLEAGQTIPNSLYLSSKPTFFGNLAWPPFSPTAPVQVHDAIPSGHRYMHIPPTVTITSPSEGTVFTNLLVNVSGIATDNVVVTNVTVNGIKAATVNGFTAWSTNITMTAGSSVPLRAIAHDSAGNTATNTVTVVVAPDYSVLDSDDVPFLWKIENWGFGFASNPQSAADADPDGDGMSNLQEWRTRTIPTDRGSRLAILRIVPQGEDYRVEWNAQASVPYRVQLSTTLTNWSEVYTLTPTMSGMTNWVDTAIPPERKSKSFYRLVVP
jgi:hypothetical protein